MQTAQVLLTFFDMSARTHYLNARQTLRKLLDWRVIPVINENDTTTTDEISFGDNDFLAAQVAILLAAERLLLLTDAEGLFTADPRVDPAARLVSEVTEFEQLEQVSIGHATSPLGSGGMRSKVVAAEMATAAGIPTVIASGLRAGAVLARGDRRSGRHPVPGSLRPLLELQAVAEVRQAGSRAGPGRRRRGARAPRGRHQPAAGRDRRGRRRVRRRRRGRGRVRRRARRQGDLQLLGGGAAPRARAEVRRRAGADAAGQRRGGPPRLLRARVTC